MKKSRIISLFTILLIVFMIVGFRWFSDSTVSISIQNAEMLYNILPKTLSRDIVVTDKLSPDGKFIGYLMEGNLWVFDIAEMKQRRIEESDMLDWVNDFEWQGDKSHIKLTGVKDGENVTEMIQLDGSEELKLEIPESFRSFSMGLDNIYAFNYWNEENDTGGLYLKEKGMEEPELILPDIYPFSFSFSPDGSMLAYLHSDNEDNLVLASYRIKDKKSENIAQHLDGSENSRIGFTSDGKHILMSLAGNEPVNLQDKHEPFADRDFDIFIVEISSGNISSIISEENDDLLVGVDGDRVYWNITKPMVKLVMIDYKEGKISPLIPQQALLPAWHPKGKEIGFVYGDWRLADFPLNWDLGTVEINRSGNVTGEPAPKIEGYHADFGLAWSPDGKWIAYQSHRSENPVLFYSSKGSTDDIYLRAASGGDEIRLTDFCRDTWMPDWSPDGTRIAFCASEKKNEKPEMKPWIITLDKDGEVKNTELLEVQDIGGNIWCAMWSPGGEQLALEVSDGSKNKSIWLVSSDGKQQEKLISYESLVVVSGLDFTPDGKEIIFSAYDGSHHQLYKIPVEGGEKERITSSAYDIIFPQVSPDGKNIAATVYRNTKQLWAADVVIQ